MNIKKTKTTPSHNLRSRFFVVLQSSLQVANFHNDILHPAQCRAPRVTSHIAREGLDFILLANRLVPVGANQDTSAFVYQKSFSIACELRLKMKFPVATRAKVFSPIRSVQTGHIYVWIGRFLNFFASGASSGSFPIWSHITHLTRIKTPPIRC